MRAHIVLPVVSTTFNRIDIIATRFFMISSNRIRNLKATFLLGVFDVFAEKQETSAGQEEENDVGYPTQVVNDRHCNNRSGWKMIFSVAMVFLQEAHPTDNAKR
jgi:hypothetical protein